MSETAHPVAERERIAFLDVLRGFAVLGILLANIPYMAFAGAIAEGTEPYIGGEGWLDVWCYGLVYLLADTKFVTLFSFLFGLGLGLMSEKALARGAPFAGVYSRRLAVLLAFGLLHIALLWFGDILATYAIVGLVAMLFRKRRVVTLLWWAGILLAVAAALWTFFGALDPEDLYEPEVDEQGVQLTFEQHQQRKIEKIRETFASGTFGEMVGQRLEIYGGFVPVLLLFFGPRTLALFLLGIAAVKSGLLAGLAGRAALLRRAVLLGVPVGLALCGASLAAERLGDGPAAGALQLLLLFFGGLVLAAGYASAIALWCRGSVLVGLRDRLAAVGRMALTNYLSHSLIASVVFLGFGQFDQWRRPALLGLVLAVFAFQLWFSPFWLRRFRFGPLEWLWRMATYGSAIPLRRGSAR